jgi:hypothetical protein
MWRLPLRGRAGVTTMGVGKLLYKSSLSPSEVEKWLTDHYTHQWDTTLMPYKVRRPAQDNLQRSRRSSISFVYILVPVLPSWSAPRGIPFHRQ